MSGQPPSLAFSLYFSFCFSFAVIDASTCLSGEGILNPFIPLLHSPLSVCLHLSVCLSVFCSVMCE
eukprot:m.353310 g.353310  ORF g.353310 m.353310 type:complete len:66 (-) comp55921_c0_seq6:774-971(-)